VLSLDIIREGGERVERRQGERRGYCVLRDVTLPMCGIRGDTEREVLQLRVEEEVEMVKPAGRLNAPDECGEVGKNVGARTVFIDDGED